MYLVVMSITTYHVGNIGERRHYLYINNLNFEVKFKRELAQHLCSLSPTIWDPSSVLSISKGRQVGVDG